MPRRARIRVANVPVHICQRGNDKGRCFFEPSDRELYLGLLAELAPQHQCAIHAYVLMTNHVHLLLTPGATDAASCLMKDLGQRYSQFINRTRGRTGTLWDGRFHSNIVDSGEYLLTCHRYVELNPVRAKMVGSPEEYPWSSYHANALGQPSIFLVTHPVIEAFGETLEQRTHAYRSLFQQEIPEEDLRRIRAALSAGTAFGSKDFEERMKAVLGRPVTVGKPGRPRKARAYVGPDDRLRPENVVCPGF